MHGHASLLERRTATACPAATPATEVCNGVDDNCNQQSTRISPRWRANGRWPWTVGSARAFSGCKSQLAPNKCLISGACYDQDAKSAINPCAQCKPSSDPVAFTIGGQSCAIGNQCVPSGTVDPGNAWLISIRPAAPNWVSS